MKFLNILGTVFVFLITLDTYAQHVQKESNDDLRAKNSRFTLENLELSTKVELRESDGVFLFMHFDKKGAQAPKKISLEQAEKIDQEFIGNFIKVKYSFPNFEGKNCKLIYKMSMRDETHQICQGEKEKISLTKNMLLSLKKYF